MAEINGYTLIGSLTEKNAGSCRWGHCKKDGKEYFIKEFLTPVYPVNSPELSEKTLAKKEKICEKFFNEKSRFYSTLYRSQTGNNVVVQKFFRHQGRFYIVTDWIDCDGMKLEQVACMSDKAKRKLLGAILYSVSAFHAHGIVHSDIRPTNLIIKRTDKDCCTAKIFDFDAGFLEDTPPAEIQGDFTYMAPETFIRLRDEEGDVDRKIDIFALGLLFHQYWAGSLPEFPEQYNYPFEAVLDGAGLRLSRDIPEHVRRVIAQMLIADPKLRPDASALMEMLNKASAHEKKSTILKGGRGLNFGSGPVVSAPAPRVYNVSPAAEPAAVPAKIVFSVPGELD